jgi:hypothetical protein
MGLFSGISKAFKGAGRAFKKAWDYIKDPADWWQNPIKRPKMPKIPAFPEMPEPLPPTPPALSPQGSETPGRSRRFKLPGVATSSSGLSSRVTTPRRSLVGGGS